MFWWPSSTLGPSDRSTVFVRDATMVSIRPKKISNSVSTINAKMCQKILFCLSSRRLRAGTRLFFNQRNTLSMGKISRENFPFTLPDRSLWGLWRATQQSSRNVWTRKIFRTIHSVFNVPPHNRNGFFKVIAQSIRLLWFIDRTILIGLRRYRQSK